MIKKLGFAKKIIFSLLIFIACSELGLRLFKNQTCIFYPATKTFPPLYVQSDINVFKLKPNNDVGHYNYFNEFIKKYHINSKGLRGRNENGDILMLGDSFIFGTGLNDDETVASHLERLSGVKVQNAGVPGYSIDNSYLAMQEYGTKKLVILGFFLENDIRDLKKHEWLVDEEGLPVKIVDKTFGIDNYNHLTTGPLYIPKWKYFLRGHSYLFTVVSENRYKLKWKVQTLICTGFLLGVLNIILSVITRMYT